MVSCVGYRSFHRACSNLAFVPKHNCARDEDIEKLQLFLRNKKSLFVLTGAGISTESGIPDYRSEGVGLYATSTKRPIQHKVFMDSGKARQSYWARNFVGWPRWSNFQPNICHRTLAAWEDKGLLRYLVTQNVDQLHYKAGSRDVVELHGTNSIVECMNCSLKIPRMAFQRLLEEVNAAMTPRCAEIRPDGDVELSAEEVANFRVPPCPRCGGILKPNVVFFGDNVPKRRVDTVRKKLSQSDGMLVIGSSLYVYSSYRFINQARENNIPIAILNIGTTRGDASAEVKIEAKAGDILPRIDTSNL